MQWPGLDVEGTRTSRPDLCPQHTSDWVWEEVGTKGMEQREEETNNARLCIIYAFHPTFTYLSPTRYVPGTVQTTWKTMVNTPKAKASGVVDFTFC